MSLYLPNIHFIFPDYGEKNKCFCIVVVQSKFTSIELVMPSNHLILCSRLLLLPSVFPSIRVFSNESVLCVRWPEYWSFSFNIGPANEYSGLISFRIDWFDLLAVRETLEFSPAPQFESINFLAFNLSHLRGITFSFFSPLSMMAFHTWLFMFR